MGGQREPEKGGGHDGPDRRTKRGHLVMEADSITILLMMMMMIS